MSFRPFTGITTTLSRTFQGGFLHGLPELFFDVALLWQPKFLVYASKFSKSRPQTTGLPSWSWVGWHGCGIQINLDMWSSGFDYVRECPRSTNRTGAWKRTSLRTEPLVRWHIHTQPGKRPITNHILAYSQSRRNPRIPVPDGWIREQDAFRHVWDPTTSFEYPIPIKDAAEESDEPPHTPLLSFQASRAWFSLQTPGFSAHATEASIVAHNGEWAGPLQPYVSDSVRVLWNASRGAPWVLPELLASPHTNMLRGICGAWHLWTSPKAP